MEDIPLFGRIVASLKALGILWFVSGIAFGAHFRDVSASFLFFFWSMPYFAAGWVLAGIPVIAIGSRVLKICAWDFGSCSRILRDLIFPLLDWTIHLLRPVAGVRYG
jgi:hypothetical protein